MLALLKRFLNYLKENPGAGFIIAFQALIVYAAVLLALGDSAQANEMSVMAYYALVIGVLWMLVDYIRPSGRSRANGDHAYDREIRR